MPPSSHPSRSSELLRQVGIVVMPGFSLLAHACATEPLHVANLLHGRTLYRLTSYSSGGDAVTSASQQTVLPREALAEVETHPDMVFSIDNYYKVVGKVCQAHELDAQWRDIVVQAITSPLEISAPEG